MVEKEREKICFVIAPIGEEDSEIRERSDKVLNYIITPAAEECGYRTVRAERMSRPGIIASQIIEHLLNDDLVVADLTSHNPNVFYELAIRHAVRKPVIQIIEEGERIPFDVAQSRAIRVNHRDLASADSCGRELASQIRSVEQDPSSIRNPISDTIDLQSMRGSGDPMQKSTAQIISMLQDIRSQMRDLGIKSYEPRMDLELLEELYGMSRDMEMMLERPRGEEPDPVRILEAQALAQRLSRTLRRARRPFPKDYHPSLFPRYGFTRKERLRDSPD